MAHLLRNGLSLWKGRAKTFKEDLVAGLIVAIVALPLAIGFAIASGVDPAMGVYTAIVAGFFAAVFGGSEYQVSGPTGAMVVVILSVMAKYGFEGLILATFLAGIILLLLGALRLGKIIEYIPSPVIVGFTAGIACIIFFGQINNFFGISPKYPAGAEFIQKTFISMAHITSANVAALGLAALTILILAFMPILNKKMNWRIPGSIVAIVVAMAVMFSFNLHVALVKDIGEIPRGLPMPQMPHFTWELIIFVLPGALTIAALAAIESLLSAVVADGLTDTRHNPNKELAGQGIANMMSAVFGGMPATGAIARTATNIRNGAKSRFAAIFHAIFLLLFVLAIGGLAAMIPLAALAGILMFVAFNMVEWERIILIFKTPLSDVVVMLTTFLLTVLVDLTVAIEVGLVLAALLFMKRMSDLYRVEEFEAKDDKNNVVKNFKHPDISIYTMNGPLFFGAASRFDQVVANTPGGHKPIKIIRMKYVPVIDATGLNFIEGTYHKHRKRGGVVLFSGVHPDVMRVIADSGLDERIGADHFFPTTRAALVHALKHAHRLHKEREDVTQEELKRYDLTTFDLQESLRVDATHDKDPVQDALDAVGVTKAQRLGKKALKQTKKIADKTLKFQKSKGRQRNDKL
jgi:sulfate permease, SulP family